MRQIEDAKHTGNFIEEESKNESSAEMLNEDTTKYITGQSSLLLPEEWICSKHDKALL